MRKPRFPNRDEVNLFCKLERNGFDSFQVLRNVFTNRAIAARRAAYELSVFILEHYLQTINLVLCAVFNCMSTRTFFLQVPLHALLPQMELLDGKDVIKRPLLDKVDDF